MVASEVYLRTASSGYPGTLPYPYLSELSKTCFGMYSWQHRQISIFALGAMSQFMRSNRDTTIAGWKLFPIPRILLLRQGLRISECRALRVYPCKQINNQTLYRLTPQHITTTWPNWEWYTILYGKNYTKMIMSQCWLAVFSCVKLITVLEKCLTITCGKLTAHVSLGSEIYTCARSCK